MVIANHRETLTAALSRSTTSRSLPWRLGRTWSTELASTFSQVGLDCFAQLGDTVGPGVQGGAIPPGENVELAVDVNLGLFVEGVT